MRIVEPIVEILTNINGDEILKHLEQVGRVCYKSEDKITDTSAKKFVEMIIKSGHEAVIEHFNITVKFITDRGCCYDKDTKVLTSNGWKYFCDINLDDRFVSLNDENNIEHIKANKFIKHKYAGDMHHWHSTQIDLMVTPNHNMWVYDYHKRSEKSRIWKFIKSEDANNKRYMFNKSANPINNIGCDVYKINGLTVPRGFWNQEYEDISYNANRFFELIGWWATDGSISEGKNGCGKRITISQTKKAGRERIIYLLNELDINHTIYDTEIRINSPQLYSWLKHNFIIGEDMRKTYYLCIPRWFYNELSSDNLKAFLSGVIGGDGTPHTKGSGFQIYTASKQFAEDLVELALYIGKAANYYIQEPRKRTFPNGVKSECKEQYVVSIVSTTETLFSIKNLTNKDLVTYDDYVYCVELPMYHRLYVMRNGKSCWCGNSHEIVRHRIASYAQESTRYVNYSKDKFGNEITVIKPSHISSKDVNGNYDESYEDWYIGCRTAEDSYFKLIADGCKPQTARSVLPTCTKTEIVMTTNLREWRHFLRLRTSKAAHPDIRVIAIDLLNKFKAMIPVVFDDINVEA